MLKGNYERMGDPHPMEGWQYYLGLNEGYQGLLSGATCRVCNSETNRGRACIRVVDSSCSAETEQNHREAKDQVLGKNPQVWSQDLKEAKLFDEENGNTLWRDAICKEMKNV
jgi:hypothetical protein